MTDLSWLTARPIAHRGLHDVNKTCWENTLSAFERAAARGYAIECDVHLSADGDVVVFHDNSLDRLTGTNGYIWQRTAGELAALRVGGTADHVPTLAELLRLVDGRVPLVIELKGIPGHDAELVERVAAALRNYKGKAAIMSFDHWLIRDFSRHAPGIPSGLTAWGDQDHELEAHFSMLAHGISFVSYSVTHLPNRFVSFVREKLAMPVITWTVRDEEAVRTTFARADQMTFEGFEPDAASVA
ncbi:glycerophosphodiester phosphodiesterase [Aminobacter aganoensis]|uniref:Glycerophosphoryl diester phosphodiesterase n=1 Tax=Aminobacter aganoensis TaxID=83264 RepID=A0A7X0F3S5_9HYPH|nr:MULTISPECIES: glycerophosphodiester phosphodiesterase [Aminobacter]KQU69931.1 glycerophosphodiester phosphodiesterase [Aminobacter sp. DSM 101952]MBB6352562.1 glycerophosphoryl diester phosphodiesterase [Aminobacter aganoensis]